MDRGLFLICENMAKALEIVTSEFFEDGETPIPDKYKQEVSKRALEDWNEKIVKPINTPDDLF